jgi:NAD(P)-dependent dehydrogenase (short-subunit alcohol dehydrogenase family)
MGVRFDFSDTVVWVTGAASGQGRRHAERFAAAGARVGCIDVNGEGVAEVVAGIRRDGHTAEAVVADVSDWSQMSEAAAALERALGPADVAVANAFRPQARLDSVEDHDIADWERVVAVCLTGVFLTAKVAIPQVRRSERGALVLISSTAGIHGFEGWSPYCAAKHGVIGLMRTLANELAPDGTRVNAICPATVDTPAIDWEAEAYGVPREELVRDEVRQNLIERLIAPDEISDAVLWLSSRAAAMVTGLVLPVDGGYLQKRVLI